MYREIKFTREELYERVWNKPVLVVAREVGVSDVALAKACRKAGIPLPTRGHWAIVKSGRKVRTPALPKAKSDEPEAVSFSVLDSPPPKHPKVEIPVGPQIEVPTELIRPHQLVAELKAAAKGLKEDKGVIPLNYRKVLRVRTSAAQLQRALILMDILIKHFEKRGYSVRINESRSETELVLKEGVVGFRLDERTMQAPPPPPPPRPSGRRAEHYEPWRPAYLLIGTGKFVLEFGKYRLGSCQTTWRDRASRSLESQLHQVMGMLPAWDAELLARRLEDERRQAQARNDEQRRISAARAEAVLRQQRSRLIDSLEAWERAERLRRFISAATPAIDDSEEGRRWLQWVNEQVAMLDPVQANPERMVDLAVKLDSYFTGYSHWNKPEKSWWD